MTDFINALVVLTNFILVPALTYGSQLALGALGVTLVYGVLRFSNFAHGEMMAFGTMITIFGTWGLQALGVSIAPLPTALLAQDGLSAASGAPSSSASGALMAWMSVLQALASSMAAASASSAFRPWAVRPTPSGPWSPAGLLGP